MKINKKLVSSLFLGLSSTLIFNISAYAADSNQINKAKVVQVNKKEVNVKNNVKPQKTTRAKKRITKKDIKPVPKYIDDLLHKRVTWGELSLNSEARFVEKPKHSGIPIHGNWVGPGHGGLYAYKEKLPAIDIVDEGARRHDICYIKKGYFNAECDRELLKYIDDNYHLMKNGKEKFVANGIKAVFWPAYLRP